MLLLNYKKKEKNICDRTILENLVFYNNNKIIFFFVGVKFVLWPQNTIIYLFDDKTPVYHMLRDGNIFEAIIQLKFVEIKFVCVENIICNEIIGYGRTWKFSLESAGVAVIH